MKGNNLVLAIIGIVIVVGALAAYNFLKIDNGKIQTESQLKKFSSIDELKTYLKESSELGAYYGSFGSVGALESRQIADVVPVAASKSLDYSTTNIQVQGVDEADIVKNDGKYIYKISGNEIFIIEAYPAENAKVLSETKFENSTPSQIFVNKNKLVVFATENYIYPYEGGVTKEAIAPDYYYRNPKSIVNIYDISDRSNPKLVKNHTIDGNYYNSRMIGNYVYLITNQPVYNFDNPTIPEPVYRCSPGIVQEKCFNIWYFDNPDSNHIFTIISSINVDNPENIESKVFLMGYTQNLYVSQENMYITYTKHLSIVDFLDRIIEGINPLLPKNVADTVNEIKQSKLFSNSEKMSAIGRVLENYTKTLSPEQRLEFQKKLENKTLEIQEEIAKELEKTIIHKISIENGKIEYKVQGEAPGNVLNQFSMDEYNKHLRIATTTDNWRTTSKNHVYVLDENLKIAGKVEDLAKGERIYSTRFLGEKGYIVTFRQIDPLFVIDLKDPTNPKILGFLKIPGVSDYLHPYDENHIIGVGRDASDEGRIKGLKLALFDISDPSNPKEVSKYFIGDRGTSSEALNDHKAFLFSRSKNLLVIPIQVSEKDNWNTFQGAYVFNLDLENGFVLKGRITHENRSDDKDKYYYDYLSKISRSLYIENVLYTISQRMIKANNLDDLKEIKSLTLVENKQPEPIPLTAEESRAT